MVVVLNGLTAYGVNVWEKTALFLVYTERSFQYNAVLAIRGTDDGARLPRYNEGPVQLYSVN